MRHWPAAESLRSTPDDRFRRMLFREPRMRAALLGYNPDDAVPRHAHLESDELFFVVSGQATFTVEGTACTVAAGDTVYVAAREQHEIAMGDEPVVLLAVVAPNLDDAWVADGDARESS